MEPIKPVYSNIKVIISAVIPVVISSSSLIEIWILLIISAKIFIFLL